MMIKKRITLLSAATFAIAVFLIFSPTKAYGATAIYRSVAPGATAVLESDTSHARNVTLTSGAATFSVALADNIGVGDAVLIDTNNDQSITSADTLLFIHARTDSTHYALRTHTGATPSDITVNDTYQIYRAYTSLSNAEAGTVNSSLSALSFTFNGGNRDLVANNEEWNIACYANGTTADTTAGSFYIKDWVTSSQNSIKVFTPNKSNEVGISQRHSGVWDNNKYRLELNGNFYIYEPSSQIDGLQLMGNNTNDVVSYDSVSSAGGLHIVSNSILRNGLRGISGTGNVKDMIAYNNIIYSMVSMGLRACAGDTCYLYNNTIYNVGSYGIYVDDAVAIAKNNIVYGSSGLNTYAGPFAVGTDYNATNGTDDIGQGTHNKTSQTFNFISTASGSEDFHLSSTDTAARNAGVDLSADANLPFNTDIDGQVRPSASNSAWDIGADEAATQIFRSVGPGATGVLESDTSHARNITLTGGTATFNVALQDNVGVGDAVLIDTGGTNDAIDASDTLLFISGRTSSTTYNLQTNTGSVPGDIAINDTYQIYRAYTSLALAEAGTKNTSIPITFNGGNRDLVTNNEEWNIATYANGTTADTTAVTIDGWNTGEQNFIKVYTPVSTNEVGVSQRHNGKWDDGKYHLVVGGNAHGIIPISNAKVIGLQIKKNVDSGGIRIYSGNNIEIGYNLITGTGSAIGIYGSSNYNSYVHNNIVYGINGITLTGALSYVYNNTVYGNNASTGYGNAYGTVVAKNNIAQNCAIGFGTSFIVGSTNNLSNVVDAPGTNPINSATVSFVDVVNNDFHLAQTDTVTRNAGANLTSEFTSYGLPVANDIDGQLRNPVGAGWDIGADEGTVEFTPTVVQNGTGGDYSTLSSWEAGVQTDLVANTTRVFSHGGKTGTVADNASVTGLTSNATATVVHATTTQILLENISGTFQSGEVVQVTSGNNVTISDNGNPASAVAKIDGAWSSADTTAVTIDGWNTGADNYIKVYTTPTSRHGGKWDEGKYILSKTNGGILDIVENYTKIDGLQIKNVAGYAFSAIGALGNEVQILNNIVKDDNDYGNIGIITSGENVKIFNNIVYGFGISGVGIYINYTNNTFAYVYNNTVSNCSMGVYINGSGIVLKNNIAVNNTLFNYRNTSYSANSSNNLSSTGYAPGTNSKINTTVNFISTTSGSEDFHLVENDTAAKNSGADLSTDPNLPFASDIDGQSRLGIWDIGADETVTEIYRSVGPSNTTALATDNLHAGTIVVASGIATFSSALPDNIGVGDAVLIDTNNDNSVTSADTLLFIHGRTSSMVYTLRTHTGAMPANISTNDTYQIYRAYTSLSNAEAGTKNTSIPMTFAGGNRDLVTSNEQWNIACYANGTTADTTYVNIADWNTSGQNFIKMYTPVYTNEVGMSQRHSGKWDDGKYNISTINTEAIWSPHDVIIEGLQIKMTVNTGAYNAIGIAIGASGIIQIDNNIIRGELSGTAVNNAGIYRNYSCVAKTTIYNNIIYGFSNGSNANSALSIYGESKAYVYNNTISNSYFGIDATAGTNFFRNNITQNCTDGYAGTFDASSDYNISNLTNDAPSPSYRTNLATTVAFADAANFDFHLDATDTSAKDRGTNLCEDTHLPFGTDIDGGNRLCPSSGEALWDIGADENNNASVQINRNVSFGRNVDIKAPVPPSYQTPALAGSVSSVYTGGMGNITKTGATNGNILLLGCSGASGGTCTVSTTAGSTSSWTQVGTVSAGITEIIIYWAAVTASGDVTATTAGTMGDVGFILAEYSGVDTNNPIIGFGTDTGFDNLDIDVDTASVTPAAGINALLVNMWASESSDRTLTMDAGWTQRINETGHIHKWADRTVTGASGSYNFGATYSGGSDAWVDLFALLKAKLI